MSCGWKWLVLLPYNLEVTSLNPVVADGLHQVEVLVFVWLFVFICGSVKH